MRRRLRYPVCEAAWCCPSPRERKMKTTAFFAILGLAAGAATMAVAQDQDLRAGATATPAITADGMKSRIDQLGYDVLWLESEHGAFEARIVDRISGGIVKARFDTVTAELLRASLAR